MNRKPALFLAVLGSLLAAVAWFGADQSQDSEIVANFAVAQDFLSAARSVDGLPWWSPMFLQGTSLAGSWSSLIANAVMLTFSIPLGFLAGPKVAMLFLMGAGAAGVFQFLRRYCGDDLCAWIGGGLFLLNSSLLVRAADYGQFPAVCVMALLPWTFLALHSFFQNPGVRTSLFPAVGFSAMALSDGKLALLSLPVLTIFSAAEYFGRPRTSRPRLQLLAWSASAIVLLAVIPNLPSLREAGFAARFDFSPFSGWQLAFSTKSALGWVDRAGWLTQGIDGTYAPTTANGGTYLGLAAFSLFTVALFLGTFHSSPEGKKARRFLILALVSFWLSFGPMGVLGGHFFYLSLSLNAPDFSPALGWFFLTAQVWVIFRLVPPDWPLRRIIASLLSLIYLLVPGFRIMEWLPFYGQNRAPFDFFQVSGAVCIVISAAILARLFFVKFQPGVMRSALTAAVCCLVILDAAPYAKPLLARSTDSAVFDDFLAAGQHIRTSSLPGRVLALSGGYFYMLTPYLTGRPLLSQAFNSHLQQREAAILHGMSFLNDESLSAYLDIAGVAHILIDKNDPSIDPELQEQLGKMVPRGFENESFLVLDAKRPLGAGFLAPDFLQTISNQPGEASAVLEGAYLGLASIHLPGVATNEPGYRGRIVDGRIEKSAPAGPLPQKHRFSAVTPSAGASYQSVLFPACDTPGWLIMNQSWHPDWKASAGGRALTIRRAFLAYCAVQNPVGKAVTFTFSPPWWYSACAMLALASWLGVLAFLVFAKRALSRSGETLESESQNLPT